jgi:hypothetical protein
MRAGKKSAYMGLVLALLVQITATAASPDGEFNLSDPLAPRVRAYDDQAREILETGLELSPTIRRLVDEIGQSDLIVGIEVRRFTELRANHLTFVSATDESRMLRIRLCGGATLSQNIGWLGHELQHAVEVAEHPEVRDERSLSELFGRIGFRLSTAFELPARFETQAADEAGRQVLRELKEGGALRFVSLSPRAEGCRGRG